MTEACQSLRCLRIAYAIDRDLYRSIRPQNERTPRRCANLCSPRYDPRKAVALGDRAGTSRRAARADGALPCGTRPSQPRVVRLLLRNSRGIHRRACGAVVFADLVATASDCRAGVTANRQAGKADPATRRVGVPEPGFSGA